MHNAAYAERNAKAQIRLVNAAVALGERFGVEDYAAKVSEAGHRNPQYAALFQKEAVADMLEQMVAQSEPEPVPEESKKSSTSTRKKAS